MNKKRSIVLNYFQIVHPFYYHSINFLSPCYLQGMPVNLKIINKNSIATIFSTIYFEGSE
jgi:hypothetical protein